MKARCGKRQGAGGRGVRCSRSFQESEASLDYMTSWVKEKREGAGETAQWLRPTPLSGDTDSVPRTYMVLHTLQSPSPGTQCPLCQQWAFLHAGGHRHTFRHMHIHIK